MAKEGKFSSLKLNLRKRVFEDERGQMSFAMVAIVIIIFSIVAGAYFARLDREQRTQALDETAMKEMNEDINSVKDELESAAEEAGYRAIEEVEENIFDLQGSTMSRKADLIYAVKENTTRLFESYHEDKYPVSIGNKRIETHLYPEKRPGEGVEVMEGQVFMQNGTKEEWVDMPLYFRVNRTLQVTVYDEHTGAHVSRRVDISEDIKTSFLLLANQVEEFDHQRVARIANSMLFPVAYAKLYSADPGENFTLGYVESQIDDFGLESPIMDQAFEEEQEGEEDFQPGFWSELWFNNSNEAEEYFRSLEEYEGEYDKENDSRKDHHENMDGGVMEGFYDDYGNISPDNLITRGEIEIAYQLGLVLEQMRVFRDYDENLLHAIIDEINQHDAGTADLSVEEVKGWLGPDQEENDIRVLESNWINPQALSVKIFSEAGVIDTDIFTARPYIERYGDESPLTLLSEEWWGTFLFLSARVLRENWDDVSHLTVGTPEQPEPGEDITKWGDVEIGFINDLFFMTRIAMGAVWEAYPFEDEDLKEHVKHQMMDGWNLTRKANVLNMFNPSEDIAEFMIGVGDDMSWIGEEMGFPDIDGEQFFYLLWSDMIGPFGEKGIYQGEEDAWDITGKALRNYIEGERFFQNMEDIDESLMDNISLQLEHDKLLGPYEDLGYIDEVGEFNFNEDQGEKDKGILGMLNFFYTSMNKTPTPEDPPYDQYDPDKLFDVMWPDVEPLSNLKFSDYEDFLEDGPIDEELRETLNKEDEINIGKNAVISAEGGVWDIIEGEDKKYRMQVEFTPDGERLLTYCKEGYNHFNPINPFPLTEDQEKWLNNNYLDTGSSTSDGPTQGEQSEEEEEEDESHTLSSEENSLESTSEKIGEHEKVVETEEEDPKESSESENTNLSQGNSSEKNNVKIASEGVQEGENDEEYNLTIEVEGEGTTYPDPGTHTYLKGDEVEVKAESNEGWGFNKWTGDVPDGEEEEKEIRITMDGDKSLTANFVRFEVSIDEENVQHEIIDEGEKKLRVPVEIENKGKLPYEQEINFRVKDDDDYVYNETSEIEEIDGEDDWNIKFEWKPDENDGGVWKGHTVEVKSDNDMDIMDVDIFTRGNYSINYDGAGFFPHWEVARIADGMKVEIPINITNEGGLGYTQYHDKFEDEYEFKNEVQLKIEYVGEDKEWGTTIDLNLTKEFDEAVRPEKLEENEDDDYPDNHILNYTFKWDLGVEDDQNHADAGWYTLNLSQIGNDKTVHMMLPNQRYFYLSLYDIILDEIRDMIEYLQGVDENVDWFVDDEDMNYMTKEFIEYRERLENFTIIEEIAEENFHPHEYNGILNFIAMFRSIERNRYRYQLYDYIQDEWLDLDWENEDWKDKFLNHTENDHDEDIKKAFDFLDNNIFGRGDLLFNLTKEDQNIIDVYGLPEDPEEEEEKYKEVSELGNFKAEFNDKLGGVDEEENGEYKELEGDWRVRAEFGEEWTIGPWDENKEELDEEIYHMETPYVEIENEEVFEEDPEKLLIYEASEGLDTGIPHHGAGGLRRAMITYFDHIGGYEAEELREGVEELIAEKPEEGERATAFYDFFYQINSIKLDFVTSEGENESRFAELLKEGKDPVTGKQIHDASLVEYEITKDDISGHDPSELDFTLFNRMNDSWAESMELRDELKEEANISWEWDDDTDENDFLNDDMIRKAENASFYLLATKFLDSMDNRVSRDIANMRRVEPLFEIPEPNSERIYDDQNGAEDILAGINRTSVVGAPLSSSFRVRINEEEHRINISSVDMEYMDLEGAEVVNESVGVRNFETTEVTTRYEEIETSYMSLFSNEVVDSYQTTLNHWVMPEVEHQMVKVSADSETLVELERYRYVDYRKKMPTEDFVVSNQIYTPLPVSTEGHAPRADFSEREINNVNINRNVFPNQSAVAEMDDPFEEPVLVSFEDDAIRSSLDPTASKINHYRLSVVAMVDGPCTPKHGQSSRNFHGGIVEGDENYKVLAEGIVVAYDEKMHDAEVGWEDHDDYLDDIKDLFYEEDLLYDWNSRRGHMKVNITGQLQENWDEIPENETNPRFIVRVHNMLNYTYRTGPGEFESLASQLDEHSEQFQYHPDKTHHEQIFLKGDYHEGDQSISAFKISNENDDISFDYTVTNNIPGDHWLVEKDGIPIMIDLGENRNVRNMLSQSILKDEYETEQEVILNSVLTSTPTMMNPDALLIPLIPEDSTYRIIENYDFVPVLKTVENEDGEIVRYPDGLVPLPGSGIEPDGTAVHAWENLKQEIENRSSLARVGMNPRVMKAAEGPLLQEIDKVDSLNRLYEQKVVEEGTWENYEKGVDFMQGAYVEYFVGDSFAEGAVEDSLNWTEDVLKSIGSYRRSPVMPGMVKEDTIPARDAALLTEHPVDEGIENDIADKMREINEFLQKRDSKELFDDLNIHPLRFLFREEEIRDAVDEAAASGIDYDEVIDIIQKNFDEERYEFCLPSTVQLNRKFGEDDADNILDDIDEEHNEILQSVMNLDKDYVDELGADPVEQLMNELPDDHIEITELPDYNVTDQDDIDKLKQIAEKGALDITGKLISQGYGLNTIHNFHEEEDEEFLTELYISTQTFEESSGLLDFQERIGIDNENEEDRVMAVHVLSYAREMKLDGNSVELYPFGMDENTPLLIDGTFTTYIYSDLSNINLEEKGVFEELNARGTLVIGTEIHFDDGEFLIKQLDEHDPYNDKIGEVEIIDKDRDLKARIITGSGYSTYLLHKN